MFSFFRKNLLLFQFIIFSFVAHFLIYGIPFISCWFENYCFYFHQYFYFFEIPKEINLRIYFETLLFYTLLSLTFYFSTKYAFSNKSKKFNNEHNKKIIIRLTNLIFFLFFFIFLIINFDKLLDFNIYRYKYNQQSLTLLWLLGFTTSLINLVFRNFLKSFLIIFLITVFIYTDGSRLWTLLVFVQFTLFLLLRFNFSVKFIFYMLIMSILVFIFYIDFINNNQEVM